MLEFFKDTIKY